LFTCILSSLHPTQRFPSGKSEACSTLAPGYVYLVYAPNDTHPYQFDAPIFNSSEYNHCIYEKVSVVLDGQTLDWDLHAQGYYCEQQEACVSTRFTAILHAFFYNTWWVGSDETITL